MRRLSIRTEDNINLKGFLFKSNNQTNKCILFVPGLEGNFIECDFIDSLAEIFTNNNYDFLCSHLRSSMQMFNSQPKLGEKYPILTGAAFEKFTDCVLDINAWLDEVINLGYTEIYIVSHSYGSNKMIYYLNKTHRYDEYINKIIFISPIDCVGRNRKRHNYNELIEKAKESVNSGNGSDLMFCGFFYQTYENFLDFMTNPDIDNFPIFSLGSKPFNDYNNINIPKVLVYGELENKYIQIIDDLINNKIINSSIAVVKGANHNYIESEDELAKKVFNLIEGEKND